jgi:hypothetical protein
MTPRSSRTTLYLILGGVAALFLCLCLLGLGGAGWAIYNRQGEPAAASPSVEYILDVSSRMELPAPGGDASRLEVARTVLADVIRPGDTATAAGLRVFGSGAAAESCQDTTLLVPVQPANQPQISQELTGLAIGPAAEPALAEAMIAAIRDLSGTEGARSLVIVTGGQDLCSDEVGQLVARELNNAGIELKTFVIGFAVTAEEAQAIKEMVDQLQGGTYLDAPDASTLEAALAAVQQFVDNPEGTTVAEVITATTPNAGPTLAPSPTPDNEAESTPQAGNTPLATSAAGEATATTASVEPEATATSADNNGAEPTVDPNNFIGETACDTLYFPLRQGASWNYSGEGMTLNWTVVEVSGDQENATVTMVADVGSDVSIDYHWSCTSEGVVSYDFGVGSFSIAEVEGMGDLQFEVTDASGSFLPPGDLTPGMTWENSYTIQSSFSVEGQSFSSSATSSQTYTAIGLETVTVPAGTFEAMRVDSVGSVTSTAMGQSFTSDISATYWFAEGVGLLKTSSSSLDVVSILELTSYNIPE